MIPQLQRIPRNEVCHCVLETLDIKHNDILVHRKSTVCSTVHIPLELSKDSQDDTVRVKNIRDALKVEFILKMFGTLLKSLGIPDSRAEQSVFPVTYGKVKTSVPKCDSPSKGSPGFPKDEDNLGEHAVG